MDDKPSEWRPGPTVCRCCLTEGCYKDISTEYFWMGKREVYAEMLSETFDLSIAYSQSGGPNSNSRLICEPCIARLRDAADFKRQVLECEKTFMHHLDPGTSAIAEIEVPAKEISKSVKIEKVKVEKRYSDDEFDSRDFGDEDNGDDDDDLDDQPLTKFATKVPKKETVDILDLLDNTQITVKRKSTSTKAAVPAKKMKVKVTKKEPLVGQKVKAIAGKSVAKPAEKKKKGDHESIIGNNIADIEIINFGQSELDVKYENKLSVNNIYAEEEDANVNSERKNTETKVAKSLGNDTNVANINPDADLKSNSNSKIAPKSDLVKHRNNIKEILICTNATAIRRYGGIGYTCCYCEEQYETPLQLKKHTLETHHDVTQANFMKSMNMTEYVVKLDITSLRCKLCNVGIETLEQLIEHLVNMHERKIYKDINNHIFPFKFDSDVLKCSICCLTFQKFRILANHMHIHYRNFICSMCEAGFVNRNALAQHSVKHRTGNFTCEYCEKEFETFSKKRVHERLTHTHGDQLNKCAYCVETFKDYRKKEAHVVAVHGVRPAAPKCQSCEKVFSSRKLLSIHIKRDHLMERPHKCMHCDMRFFSTTHLKHHLVTHTKTKEFACDVCLKAFGRRKTLLSHMRIHDAEKRFKCEHCGQKFVQKCSWRIHMRNKHADIV